MGRMRMLVLTALAVLLLGGCFRYQSSVTVEDDGSGRAQEMLLVDRAVLAPLFPSDAELEAHVPRADRFTLPAWAIARDHRVGDLEGVVLDIVFDTPEQFGERLDAVHRMVAAAIGSQATSTADLVRRDDGWEFTMATDDLAGVPAFPPGSAGTLTPLYHGSQLVVAVQLPGRLLDHNADQVDDGLLVWRLSAQSVQTRLFARTTTGGAFGGGGRSVTLQVATAVATVGGIAVFAVVALNRRRRGGETAPPATAHLGDHWPSEPGPPAVWPHSPPSGPPVDHLDRDVPPAD